MVYHYFQKGTGTKAKEILETTLFLLEELDNNDFSQLPTKVRIENFVGKSIVPDYVFNEFKKKAK